MCEVERHMPAQVNKKELVKQLDRLATAAEYARVPARRRKSGFKSWGGKTSTVAFVRENLSVLEEVVTACWSAKTEIQLTTDPTAIEEALIPVMRTLHADARPAVPSDVEAVFAAVEAQPVEDYEVFQPIFGAAWDVSSAPPLEFGPFTVYHRAAHRAHLEWKYPSSSSTVLAHRKGPCRSRSPRRHLPQEPYSGHSGTARLAACATSQPCAEASQSRPVRERLRPPLIRRERLPLIVADTIEMRPRRALQFSLLLPIREKPDYPRARRYLCI
jgi:hypothetical protein